MASKEWAPEPDWIPTSDGKGWTAPPKTISSPVAVVPRGCQLKLFSVPPSNPDRLPWSRPFFGRADSSSKTPKTTFSIVEDEEMEEQVVMSRHDLYEIVRQTTGDAAARSILYGHGAEPDDQDVEITTTTPAAPPSVV